MSDVSQGAPLLRSAFCDKSSKVRTVRLPSVERSDLHRLHRTREDGDTTFVGGFSAVREALRHRHKVLGGKERQDEL